MYFHEDAIAEEARVRRVAAVAKRIFVFDRGGREVRREGGREGGFFEA